MGIIVKKIKRVWESYGILQPNQHSGRKFHGTHTATIESINIIEQAQESHSDIFSTSWDIKRALIRLVKIFRRLRMPDWGYLMTSLITLLT